MINYEKLMAQKPTVYTTLVNSLQQVIDLVEHPTMGDEAQVIAVCHDLRLASYSSFYDTYDMLNIIDYEPSFIEGKFYIGDMEYED